nr:DUF5763 domain-containing protein [Natrarchaeobaculum sulfurireducens]
MKLLDDSEVGGIGDSFPGVGVEDGESDGSDDEPDQCIALTASGERCSRSANEDGFCHQHDESDETVDDEKIVPEGGQE